LKRKIIDFSHFHFFPSPKKKKFLVVVVVFVGFPHSRKKLEKAKTIIFMVRKAKKEVKNCKVD
jgi:hypothetical protein